MAQRLQWYVLNPACKVCLAMGYSLASSLPSLLSVATHLILNELKDASHMRNKKPCISYTDRNTQSYSCEAPYDLRGYLDNFHIEDMM